jgi:hypothetical protein
MTIGMEANQTLKRPQRIRPDEKVNRLRAVIEMVMRYPVCASIGSEKKQEAKKTSLTA